jgi:acetyl esterase/lipase
LASGEANTIDLVSFVRENSAAYSLHPDRITVWAFSAGGPMLTPFMRARPSYVRAMLAFYAVLDTPNRPDMTEDDRQQWEKYSARANILFPGRGCCLPPSWSRELDSTARR